tara:strand:- start:3993 stop:4607 length:615 start_codon:yes stop_codon:yes gene_type:complete
MATRNINDFKNSLRGGVRPNLFNVQINFPDIIPNAEGLGSGSTSLEGLSSFLCRSAALPASTQGLIEVPFRGRFLKIPGDRTFEAWTATFYNTKDFNLRRAFELWINAANKTDENVGTLDFGAIGGTGSYFSDLVVQQKAKNSTDEILREYHLIGAWPTNVSAINLAYDSNDQIEEFDVEFQYQYMDVGAGNFSVGSGDLTTQF